MALTELLSFWILKIARGELSLDLMHSLLVFSNLDCIILLAHLIADLVNSFSSVDSGQRSHHMMSYQQQQQKTTTKLHWLGLIWFLNVPCFLVLHLFVKKKGEFWGVHLDTVCISFDPTFCLVCSWIVIILFTLVFVPE